MGYSSEDIKIRFQWTFPIVFSRHNAERACMPAGNVPLSLDQRRRELDARSSPDLVAPRPEDDGRVRRPDHEGPDGRRDVRAHLRVRRVAADGRTAVGRHRRRLRLGLARQRRELDERHAEGHRRLHAHLDHRAVALRRRAARTSRRTATSSATSARSSTRRPTAARRWTKIVQRHHRRRSSRASSARIR